MYLKRLELRGFKTFASYTDFLFDAGITAIVGPNGSGKSNIADAVRWVLGEQSYSALRGKRTEDMIFAGTSRRPQLGMAEAILTFDNASHWLPLDFSEVTVARRAYRSGENQYLINGSRVRLRDVLELLGKAALGRQGFVVIGQGLVDAALSLRPEERRILFEEAAGIHIYQEKRSDALSKLAETQQNTLRLNDILTEITPRMRDLERQSKRAQERELLSQDLEKLLRIWYGYHWQRLQARVAEAEAALHRRQEELSLSHGRLHEVEALISSTQSRQNELRRHLSLWHKASSELHSRAETTGRQLAVARERLDLLQARQMELQTETARLQARRVQLEQNVATTQAECTRLQQEVQSQIGRLQQLHSDRDKTETLRQELEQNVEQARDKTFRLATALADARNRLKALRERRAQLLAEHDRSQGQLATVAEELASLKDDIEAIGRQQGQRRRAQEEATARQSELREKLATLEAEQTARREALSAALRHRQRAQDRYEILQELRQSLTGLAPGVRTVLEARKRLPGILGPVIELLRVPQKLEQAIEAALGSYAQALVVETWDNAMAAIAELQHSKGGWATFLPLDSLSPAPAKAAPAATGVVGLAQELVQYDARYDRVFQLLLGRVVIVQDLEIARHVQRKLQPGQRIVTLSGEVVQATGVVSGGSGDRQATLLAQEREWRELPARLATLQQEEESREAALREITDAYDASAQEAAAAADESRELTLELEETRRRLSDLQHKADRLQSESEWLRRVADSQQRESHTLDEKETELQRELDQRTEEHSVCNETLHAALAKLEAARREEECARETVTEAEIALALAERQADTYTRLLSTQRTDLERLDKETTERSKRVTELQEESAQLSSKVHALQEDSNDLTAQISALAAQMDPAEGELQSLESQSTALEQERARARQRVSEQDALYGQQVLEKERRRDALESMEQRIEEDLGDIEYPSERVRQLRLEFLAQEQSVLPPLQALPDNVGAEIRDLKMRLRRMGSVNPNAPQEYREVSERYGFLRSQIADLEQSASSLQHVIRELDEVMRSEFLAVFSVVAAEFSGYFEVLFRGGQARLTLTDPENVTTTGVEIFARPPGKRQQSLALLSGGERALTATALLFAVLKARPLPFCFLDEVDAMLDEANVGRFRALLDEFSQRTQFVVITHNRQTIEAANTIYGVSMGEDGVSKVISLQLHDVQKADSR